MHTYLLGREKNQSIRSSADTHTNKQTKANVEPECQLLDLHQHPNQNTHKGWLRHKGLKKKKGARRDQLNLLPTYFIWCEDQGDVVPLRREKGLA